MRKRKLIARPKKKEVAEKSAQRAELELLMME